MQQTGDFDVQNCISFVSFCLVAWNSGCFQHDPGYRPGREVT